MPKTKGPRAGRARRRNSRNDSKVIHSPPTIPAYPTFRKRFRFTVGTGITDQPVIGYDLLGLLGCATSTTGVRSICSSVKVHRISIWCSNSGTNTSFPDVHWTGVYAKEQKNIDVSVGNAQPAFVTSVPPKGSDCDFWVSYQTGSTTKFTMTAPVGSVVDLEASIILTNGATSPTVNYVSTGLTLGMVLFGPLDHNTGTPRLIPLDVAYYG